MPTMALKLLSTTESCTITNNKQTDDINLRSSINIQYEKRDGMHGVSYCADGSEEGWTSVTGKRLKRAVPLHLVLHHRAPPHDVRARLPPDSESSGGNDCSDVELNIPDHANINFSVIDDKPGLQMNTRNIKSLLHVHS